MAWWPALQEIWQYTYLSQEEQRDAKLLASTSHRLPSHGLASRAGDSGSSSWKSLALTEVLYRRGDPLSFIFGISSFLPIVVIIFLSGMASAPSPDRRVASLALLVFLVISVCLNVLLKCTIRSDRPLHPSAGISYSTEHGMPSDHAQFMAAFVVYLSRRWRQLSGRLSALRHKERAVRQESDSAVSQPLPFPLGALFVMATLVVGVGRVYNAYHSVGQVLTGWVIGAALAIAFTTPKGQRLLYFMAIRLMLPVMLHCTSWTELV